MKEGSSTIALSVPTSGAGLDFPIVDQPLVKEELDGKLEQARGDLLDLRRRQEELEQVKGELEELRRKQDEYSRGRTEMLDNLTRSLVTLEREQIEAQRLADLCSKTMEAFGSYKERIEAINDENWTGETLRPELSRALGLIHDSRLEYNRARTKLDCLNPGANQPAAPVVESRDPLRIEPRELLRYGILGAVATAPLIIVGTIWLLVLISRH